MRSAKAPLLVVDDDLDSRELLARRFRRAGYDVETADCGRVALERIERERIDLVLLDSMMPGMTGPELLRQLRTTHTPSDLPVVMVTALHDSQKIVEALDSGANDYLTKPVDFSVALARVEAQLKRKRMEEALRESEERFALAARGANDGLWDWDLKSGQLYLSPRWKEMLGYADAELENDMQEWLARVHADDRPEFARRLEEARHGVGPAEFLAEYRIRHRDGEHRWMLSRGGVLAKKDGQRVRMAGSQTDITKNKSLDALTGLANRILFTELVAREVAEARAGTVEPFAVFFIDLDRFKNVNDSLGHQAGDRLLIEVGRRLDSSVRAHRAGSERKDLVARLGGDEFAVLVRGVSDKEQLSLIAARLRHEIGAPMYVENRELFVSASIGIAQWQASYKLAAELLRDADTAMYSAKSAGRAREVVFDEKMRASAMERLEIEAELQRALAENEFEVYYQPKVRLASGELTGFEALVRWNHPRRGVIPPAGFIGVAEETLLIVPIGEWVLRQACATLRKWQLEAPDLPHLEMSVNLSVRQFRQPDLVSMVMRILDETGLDPQCLKLEITESVLLESPSFAIEAMQQLKERNVGLKIDDFGTGYSSLNYLTRLPFESLKIDRSFVTDMLSDNASLEVVRAILALAANLNLEVVAEGIETRAVSDRLHDLGCRLGQGFFFSRPVPEREARAILAHGRCPVD